MKSDLAGYLLPKSPKYGQQIRKLKLPRIIAFCVKKGFAEKIEPKFFRVAFEKSQKFQKTVKILTYPRGQEFSCQKKNGRSRKSEKLFITRA